jgi:hypothetical protein
MQHKEYDSVLPMVLLQRGNTVRYAEAFSIHNREGPPPVTCGAHFVLTTAASKNLMRADTFVD